jgi:hypothetical protein
MVVLEALLPLPWRRKLDVAKLRNLRKSESFTLLTKLTRIRQACE